MEHEASYSAGWWHHRDTGLPYIPGDKTSDGRMWWSLSTATRELIVHYWPFVLATKLALVQSEVGEGLEALRKDSMDDKLPHRSGLATELADTVIRIRDIAGAVERARDLGIVVGSTTDNPFDLHGAIAEKMRFNATRPDHAVAARRKTGGKVF